MSDPCLRCQQKNAKPLLAQLQTLLQKSVPNAEHDGKVVADLLAEAWVLEHAGINLGRETTFQLNLAMRDLIAQHGLADVRFFGKVLGRQGDYYVIESKNTPDVGGTLGLETVPRTLSPADSWFRVARVVQKCPRGKTLQERVSTCTRIGSHLPPSAHGYNSPILVRHWWPLADPFANSCLATWTRPSRAFPRW